MKKNLKIGDTFYFVKKDAQNAFEIFKGKINKINIYKNHNDEIKKEYLSFLKFYNDITDCSFPYFESVSEGFCFETQTEAEKYCIDILKK